MKRFLVPFCFILFCLVSWASASLTLGAMTSSSFADENCSSSIQSVLISKEAWLAVNISSSSTFTVKFQFQSNNYVKTNIVSMDGNAASVSPTVYTVQLNSAYSVHEADQTLTLGDSGVVNPCGFWTGNFTPWSEEASNKYCNYWMGLLGRGAVYRVDFVSGSNCSEIVLTNTKNSQFVLDIVPSPSINSQVCTNFVTRNSSVWWKDSIQGYNYYLQFNTEIVSTSYVLGSYKLVLENTKDCNGTLTRAYSSGQFQILSNYSTILTKKQFCYDYSPTPGKCTSLCKDNMLDIIYGLLKTNDNCTSWNVNTLGSTYFTESNPPPLPSHFPTSSSQVPRDNTQILIVVGSIVGCLVVLGLLTLIAVTLVRCIKNMQQKRKYIGV
ncbi:hypothetical protein C9374_010274 [Naegleria lovaniensis]|uniref:Uncharacterized protein n=1 Tax=Naegleria lovaniensis TaxID=51637 RepID=A0AA88KDQ1_NAELO|nr:uncharacterized protein C9374_010274 [Naegleria lovaniensis]KAG2374900.1 hypothetical protein C9374_010274 [Naegleria lovaniensis]